MTPPAEALWLGAGLPLAAVSVLWLSIGLVAGLAMASATAAWAVRGRLRPRPTAAHDREPQGVAPELARSRDLAEAARLFVEHVQATVAVDAAALLVVDEGGKAASGAYGHVRGHDVDPSTLHVDLENEPSGIATAVFEAVPFTIFDATASVRANRPFGDSVPLQSVAYVPLVAQERVIGVLALGTTNERRAFTTAELTLLETLAGEAAPALELARATSKLAAALERERRRLAAHGALLRAAQSLTGVLQLDTVLQRLVRQVAELLEADAADCYLLDADRNVLRCEAVHGLPETLVGFEFPAQNGLAGRALELGGAVTDDEYADVDQPVPNQAYAGFATAMVAPMRVGNDVQGVVGVGIRGTRRFDEDAPDLLEAFAGVASLALTNAQAFDARSRQARVQRGFFRIASALGQSLSLQATLEAVAQAANDALGASFTAVLLPRGPSLALAGAAGLPEVLAQALETDLPDSARCLRVAAAEGHVLAAPRLQADDRFGPEWIELCRRAGLEALVAVPVASAREEANGLVLVCFDAERSFTDEDLELARHLADAARGGLERSELFEAERTARALSQQLARTGSVLATELDPAAVLVEVAYQAPTLLGADGCVIRTVEDGELVVNAAYGPDTEDVIGARVAQTAGLAGDVFQSRSPVAVEDVTRDERRREADPLLAEAYAACLAVPLSGPEGTLHGVLAVYARRPRSWRPEEIEALLALAANTSAALSNAELYSRVSIEKERSAAILANIADGIVAVDRDGRVVLWNAAAEEITGVPAEEALGRTPEQVLQRALEADDDGTSGPRLVSIQRAGEEVWLSLSEAVMRDPLGTVAGRIFAFRDISADRTVEQVKSDFVAAVSHGLRTPLTSIYGFAETLLRRDVLFGEEERRTFLGYIASESQRLTQIVDRLLNVARLDAGDFQVAPEPTDIGSLVSEVTRTVDVNGRRIELDLPSEPLAAEADPDKLRQVFTILVDNALKFSPNGGTVTLGARRGDGTVELRVVDEGIGIPAAEQERIFRKFYRAEAPGRAGAGGTGLGLFIARELVTAMGGRIWVESAEGTGSKFVFELPESREWNREPAGRAR